jgi:anaerobic magnesium-protoporphyrin IX monomethyl ester cyclase
MNKNGPVVLLYAPPSDPTQSYTSLPTLAAYLRTRGVAVEQKDLGIELLDRICTSEFLQAAWSKSERMHLAPPLTASFQERRGRLAGCARYIISEVERAKRVMRDADAFFDLERYRWATTTLSLACDIASLPSHPAQLGPANFEANADCSLAGLLEVTAAGRRENFFAPLFERHSIPDVLRLDPLLIGISVTYHFQVVPAFTLARMLKLRAPNVPVVIGGAIIARMESHLLSNPRWFDFADYYVVGEGETALMALVQSLRDGHSIPRAPNLIQRKRGLPMAHHTDHVEDVRELPCPDFDGLDLQLYLSPEPVLLMPTTRGCYYGKCTFCDVSRQTRTVYRPFQRKQVAANVARLNARHGARRFFFCDDAVPMTNMLEVAELVSKQLPDVTWQAEARLEKTMTLEFLTQLKQGGCRQLMFGFESTSQRVLNLMAKNNKVETDQRVLEACAAAGIAVNLQTFIGLPGETKPEAEATVQYLLDREREIASFGFGVFSLYKDTPIYKEPEKHGVTSISIPVENNLLAACDFEPLEGMTRAEAREVHDQALEKLTSIYRTRSHLLGGAAGAHSLLQFSQYEFRNIYERWRDFEDKQVRSDFIQSRLELSRSLVYERDAVHEGAAQESAADRNASERSAAEPLAVASSAARRWMFHLKRGEVVELGPLDQEILAQLAVPSSFDAISSAVVAKLPFGTEPAERFRLQFQIAAAVHALLRAGVLQVAAEPAYAASEYRDGVQSAP